MSEEKEIPVLLITGYLGSGKTTLLNYILSNRIGLRAAVIVNDIGEVNIDASLIQKGGIVGQGDDQSDLVALQNGCICCSLRMDLVNQINELASSGRFDYIVIEASGICEPVPIAQTICSIPLMEKEYHSAAEPRLDCIATVVDALRLRDEFGCGETLAAASESEGEEENIESLIIEQIEFCNVILLNKISEVTREEADRVRAVIRAIQPTAKIIECDYAKVDLDELINTHMFDFERVATSAAWIRELEGHHHHDDEDDEDEHEHEHHHHHDEDEEEHEHEHHHDHDHGPDCDCEECKCGHHHHHGHSHIEEYGIETFVYYRRPGFDLNKFDWFVTKNWPKEVIRTKGVMYFSHNTDMSYLFEQAGRQKKLSEAGLWFATASEEELERLMVTEPGLQNDWDPEYGDRMVKLVFIGRNMDRKAIEAALDSCLSK